MGKPYVYITRKVPKETITVLEKVADVSMWPHEEEPVPRDILLQEAKKADGLFTMLSDKVDKELLNGAPNVKVIANLAVGFDNIDVQTATAKKIVVCNTPDVLTDTTADLTFVLLMATARRIVEASDYVKDGKWKNWGPLLLAGTDIHHKTIGIVGMGRIGSAVAKRATGFDMEILYHNRSKNEQVEKELGATYVSFAELVKRSDYVVCLAPLTKETENLFTWDIFKQMKKTAIFINASRGAVVDEEALEKALEEQEIGGAGLDVFRKEPISEKHPLLCFPNVVALPHIGSASMETRYAMCKLVSRNIANVLDGTKPETIVNPEVLG